MLKLKVSVFPSD